MRTSCFSKVPTSELTYCWFSLTALASLTKTIPNYIWNSRIWLSRIRRNYFTFLKKLRGSVKKYFINFNLLWKVISLETIGAAKNLRSTNTQNTLWRVSIHIALCGFMDVWRSIDTFLPSFKLIELYLHYLPRDVVLAVSSQRPEIQEKRKQK